MPTVSKDLADLVVAGNGYYVSEEGEEDPKVIRIVKYIGLEDGRDNYGLIYDGQEITKYHDSPYCIGPEIYWEDLAYTSPNIKRLGRRS